MNAKFTGQSYLFFTQLSNEILPVHMILVTSIGFYSYNNFKYNFE